MKIRHVVLKADRRDGCDYLSEESTFAMDSLYTMFIGSTGSEPPAMGDALLLMKGRRVYERTMVQRDMTTLPAGRSPSTTRSFRPSCMPPDLKGGKPSEQTRMRTGSEPPAMGDALLLMKGRRVYERTMVQRDMTTLPAGRSPSTTRSFRPSCMPPDLKGGKPSEQTRMRFVL
ncbi:hypothetical protein T265_09568 [Opisthorchis viverrini]|uniref:Uncharacterized protein n=1 Tax=Opisthorchis viverrini TaxID=6198 RepID=A0A074ZGE2_OPIVI|nr:hypothetical protein T265_09568 [Opisthorchis viverrini]KER22325.1 hypothetical protein T265_09568 [Opisthorchis viverrini]